MKKVIKQWGNSLVLRFNSEECRAYGLEEGDIVDIEITVVARRRKK